MAFKALVSAVSLAMLVSGHTPHGYQGCYQEGTDGRALTGNAFVQDNMTVEICQTLCNGTRFYGLEYGNQCYCGTKLDNDAYQVPDSSCAIPCSGDTTKTCGGLSLLSLYRNNFTSQFPAYDYVEKGCYREPSDHRALTRVLTSNLMTRTKCLVICSYGDFNYAGLEYGQECWCGQTFSPDASPAEPRVCSMPCVGNSSETCGGKLALQVFARNGTSF